jgi:hypothetical protein
MTIPAGVEKMILDGRAVNRVVTHKADRFFINPPESGFIIIYGWEFIPPLVDILDDQKPIAFSFQVASDKGVDYFQHNIWPTAYNGQGDFYQSIYLVTDQPVQWNVYAQIGDYLAPYGTVKDDDPVLNNFPPQFAADFTDNNTGLNYLVALDLPLNPINLIAGVYYPFGSEYTEQFFGASFTGVGFDSWLLAPNAAGSVIRYNTVKSTLGGEMRPEAAFGITVHYAIVGEKLPPKTAKGWIIDR